MQPVGAGICSMAVACVEAADCAGTSAWAWQDQSTHHSHHGLERDPITSGYKMMTERGRNHGPGEGGEQELAPRTAMQFRRGEKQGNVSCLHFFVVFFISFAYFSQVVLVRAESCIVILRPSYPLI